MPKILLSCFFIWGFLCRLFSADVLGIDFGSEFVKVARISPGKSFEIVLDESSKRAHPQLVVFGDDKRSYGTSASSFVSKRPFNAFLQFSRLLGKNIDSPVIDELRKNFIFNDIIPDTERNTLRLVLNDKSNFTIEEITSMALRHCRRIAESESSKEVKDSVLIVPEFYTHKERQAFLDAANLAGLNVLSLINENTAAALQYALNKEYATNKTETYIFFNMGSTSTKASIVRYSAYAKSITRTKNKTIGQFEVLATSWDQTLGGSNFDQLMVNSLIDSVKEQLNKQVEEPQDKEAVKTIEKNPRVMARLRQAAAKAKKILSANQETGIRVESIYKDFDFKVMFSREDLIKLASEAKMFYRAEKVLDDVVTRGNFSKEDIDAIVVIGGATRIPRVKKLLNDYLGKKVREDINADEASALGAAFRAANISTSFRVRPVGMIDITNAPASVRLTDMTPDESLPKPWSKRGSLFSGSNRLHKRRAVAFKHSKNIRAVLKYDKTDRLPLGTSHKLPRFNVTGIEAAIEKYKPPKYNVTELPKVSLAFLLDSSGVLDMAQAVATFSEWVTIYPKTTTTTEAPKLNVSDGNSTETGEETTSTSTTTETPVEANATANATEAPKPIHKKKTHRVVLKIHREPPSDYSPYTKETTQASQGVLLELEERDQAVKDTADAKYALESYIFDHRTKCYEDKNVEKVSTEEEREAFVKILGEAEEWIWELEEETASVFKTKLREIRTTGDPIFLRAVELVERPKAFQQSRDFIEHVRGAVVKMKEAKPWITEEEFADLENKTTEYSSWLADKEFEQGKKSLTETPIVFAREITNRGRIVYDTITKLERKPKPRPKPKKKVNGTGVNGTDFEFNGTKYTQEDIEELLRKIREEEAQKNATDGTEPIVDEDKEKPKEKDEDDGEDKDGKEDKTELRRRTL